MNTTTTPASQAGEAAERNLLAVIARAQKGFAFASEIGDVINSLKLALRAELASQQGAAPVGGLSDAEMVRILNNSELRIMHQEMGWYSAPEKAFREKGLALGRAIESALFAATRSPVAAEQGLEGVGAVEVTALGLKPPKLNYTLLHAFASTHHLSYNDLCTVVRDSIIATPSGGAGGSVGADTISVLRSDVKYAMGFLYSHEQIGEPLKVCARFGNALQNQPKKD